LSQAKKSTKLSERKKKKKQNAMERGLIGKISVMISDKKNNNNNSHGLGLIIERNVMRLIRTKDTIAN
jgi:hypothetical protein